MTNRNEFLRSEDLFDLLGVHQHHSVEVIGWYNQNDDMPVQYALFCYDCQETIIASNEEEYGKRVERTGGAVKGTEEE